MVFCDENKVLYGPSSLNKLPLVSTGKLLFEKIKNAPKKKAALINEPSGVQMNYEDLLIQSVKLAKYFQNVGVHEGDTISVISENTTKFVIPVLAALYQGVAVNCLSHTYTTGEFARLLNHTKPKLIFCSEIVQLKLKPLRERAPYINEIITFGEIPYEGMLEQILLQVTDNDIDSFQPKDVNPYDTIALILTSSGTTGLPKSVLLPHICSRQSFIFMSDKDYGHMNSNDISSLVVPVTHPFGLILLTSVLYTNSTAVIMGKFQPECYLNAIQKHKITKLYVVPTIMNLLAKSDLLENYNLESVCDIVCAGAPLSVNISKVVKERFKFAKVRQMYGLTELGTGASMQLWNNQKILSSVGKLIHDLEGKIWDRERNVALGPYQKGELLIKGPISMKGYIDNKEETDAAFDDEGFLRTGDAAYYDDDGNIYIVDRFKELIKYKGFQVAPAEIESLLLKNPNVRECAVVPKPDEKAGEVPIAFVVKQGSNVTERELVQEVNEQLSINKRLYGGIVFVDELPKNSFGKILRNSLKLQAASYCK
ncbi:4-coumarate--CoA ligase 1-like [Agrilus planipennis]|uniref:Luciferin 4-monooxygenase n=1 Tax=Agrilus planipennis TaxID=224129 RepID=A0A1W4WIG4_AGRPL|nr:4-coumarate--CoA ligase 1-like [Agrilus planipennis]